MKYPFSLSKISMLLFMQVMLCSFRIFAQTQETLGSDSFPVNDNFSGSITAAVNGGWQINGFGKVCKLVRDSSTLFALTASGGIYKSIDNGQSWISLSGSFLPGVQMNALAIDPINPDILYAGTGEIAYASAYGWGGYGVFKSIDGGVSWNISNTGMGNLVVSDVLINRNISSDLVASTSDGLFLSSDSGATWTMKHRSGSWVEQIVQRENSDTLFAISGDSLFTSFNFGNSWTARNLDPSSSVLYLKGRVAIAPSNPDVMYASWIIAVGASNNKAEVFQSTDGGITFIKKYNQNSLPTLASYDGSSNGNGYGWANWCISVDPNNPTTIYTGAHLVYKSTNGGATFSSTFPSWWCCLHTDIQQLLFLPGSSDSILAVCDGGVFITPDRGVSWQSSSHGISCTQYYTFGNSHIDSTYVVGGTQDNGIMYLKNDNRIHTYAGGDYSDFTLCDYFHPHNTYTGSSGGVVFDPYNRANYADINLPTDLTNAFSFPCLEFSTLHAGRAYGFRQSVWITSNLDSYTMSPGGGTSTVSWTLLTSLGSANVLALAIAPDNDDRFYLVTDDGKFHSGIVSGGSLQSLIDITLPGPSDISASITISKLNPDVIYVVANNKVFHSSNGGVYFEDITRNLPSVNFQGLYIDPFSTVEGIYLVSDVGVYYSDWTLPAWKYLNPDFQSSIQNSDATFYQVIPGSGIFKGINSATSHVAIGTWGAGFQQVKFYIQKCEPLPFNWSLKNYGAPFTINSACYDSTNGGSGGSNAYTISTNGNSIGGTDQFSMVQGEFTGDGSLSSTIYSIEKGDLLLPGEAGLMMRNNTDMTNSPFAMVGLNANGEVFFRYRLTTGSAAIDSIVLSPSVPFPIDVKIVKSGNNISAYCAGQLVGQINIILSDTIAGGAAVASGGTSLTNQSAISDIIDSGFVQLNTRIENTIHSIDATLFPDPAHNTVTIQLNVQNEINFIIYDLLGKEMKSGIIPANSMHFNVDVSEFPQGNYFIQLTGVKENLKGNLRFIKN